MRVLLMSLLAAFCLVALAGCGGGPKAVTPTSPATDAPKGAIGISGGPKVPEAPK